MDLYSDISLDLAEENTGVQRTNYSHALKNQGLAELNVITIMTKGAVIQNKFEVVKLEK